MPDLSAAVRVSPMALEPYRVVPAPAAGADAAAGWFGPLAPLAPLAPKSVAGRQFDYPPGYNLVTRPRAYEPIGFGELRALADAYDLMRLIDNVNFRYAGTLLGGTTMGSLSANFPSGADPDTVNTLAVDLTETEGQLAPGTQADADQGHTLCLVDSELVTFEQATLTAQYKYNLGKSGSTAGYLRRGVYGTTIAAHSAGAPFARLRPGSYFTLGYASTDVGKTIYVKLLSFNPWGGGRQTLDQVGSYSHTLTAPPVPSTGLLSGLIQGPDVGAGSIGTSNIAANAATNQITVSQPSHVAIPVAPSLATLVSGTLTTIGGVVQVAYNAQFINQSSSASDSVAWYLYCDGTQIDTGTITIAASSAQTIAKQTSYTPAAGSHVFTLEATDTTGTGFTIALLIDLSATEIRR